MDKETGSVALVLVTILLVFVALQPIIPPSTEKFSELGVLGPNQTIGDYPTNVTVGQEISLYGFIANHEGAITYYSLVVKLGNNGTIVSNSTSAVAPVVASYFHVLDNNESWTFPIGMSVNQTGNNQRLIFELWAFNDSTSSFSYIGLWNQLWINVTST